MNRQEKRDVHLSLANVSVNVARSWALSPPTLLVLRWNEEAISEVHSYVFEVDYTALQCSDFPLC